MLGSRSAQLVASVIGAVGAGLLLGAVGCLATTNFDGVAGTRPPVEDAGSDDGAPGTPVNAPVDAGPTVLDCQTQQHLVCSTFDKASVVAEGWGQQIGGLATLNIDGSRTVSPPGALHSNFPAVTNEGAATAFAKRTVDLPPYTVLLWRFDMFLGTCAVPGDKKGFGITLASLGVTENSAYGLILRNDGLDGFMQTLSDGTNFGNIIQMPRGRWFHVDARIETAAAAAHSVLKFDDAVVLDQEMYPGAARSSLVLTLGGALPMGPSVGCDVWFDNFAFDAE